MLKQFIVVLLFIAAVVLAQEGPPKALRKMLDEQTAAWNRGDLEGFMHGYWNSPELTFFSGDTIYKGWQAALDRYRKKYGATAEQMGHLSFSDEQFEMFGVDGAVYSARWHLSLQDGRKLEGLTTVVCKRMADGWKIVHDHSS